jgi:hypothetical protein
MMVLDLLGLDIGIHQVGDGAVGVGYVCAWVDSRELTGLIKSTIRCIGRELYCNLAVAQ